MDDKNMLNDEELKNVIGGTAKVVAADDAANTTKVTDSAKVEIVKNGKKFTAVGAKMK